LSLIHKQVSFLQSHIFVPEVDDFATAFDPSPLRFNATAQRKGFRFRSARRSFQPRHNCRASRLMRAQNGAPRKSELNQPMIETGGQI
jgi:hypothetical protein